MHTRILYTFSIAAVLLLAACSKEEPAVPAPDDAQRLSITIADGGYASADAPRTTSASVTASRLTPSDAPATRAAENGYTTDFTAGDACGLYIVRGDEVVAANIRLTASAATDGTGSGAGLVWTPDASAGTLYHAPGDRYFLYYPWQSAPMDAPAEGAEFAPSGAGDADAEFFAAMIGAWTPMADQSDYENYTASDLMTAEGTAGVSSGGAVPLAFSMTHRMALAVVEMPETVYKFEDYPDIDYSTCVAEADFTGAANPYPADGFYRYLVHPAAGAELTATYDDGMTHQFTVSIAGNSLAPGSYKTYKVDGGRTVKEYATYAESGVARIGDFYCTADGGSRGYLIPKEADEATVQAATVVGIVFQTDKSRIGQAEKEALAAKGIAEPHGLVMSVKNAGTSLKWSSNSVYETTGATVCTTVAACYQDISGLKNTREIYKLDKYKESADDYPAFKVVADFNTNNTVPENATEWFMPSAGQLWDLLENLGKVEALKAQRTNDSDDWYDYDSDNDICSSLNSWLANVTGADLFGSGYNYFWSSSEYSSDRARRWRVYSDGYVGCYWDDKDHNRDVRPVLAF